MFIAQPSFGAVSINKTLNSRDMGTVELYLGSLCTLVAALLHFACLFWDAKGYRFLGAGGSLIKKIVLAQ